jgi:hypothetical protein
VIHPKRKIIIGKRKMIARKRISQAEASRSRGSISGSSDQSTWSMSLSRASLNGS